MPSPTPSQGSLAAKARALLRVDKRSLIEISQATGISFYWLRKFKAGEIADPSVNTVQELYEKLTGSKLKV